MKIAQIAPLWETVPPKAYGGTELVVYNLTEHLIKQGHKVTLFATGDSQTSAELIPIIKTAMRKKGTIFPYFYEIESFSTVLKMNREFDIIHNHVGFHFLPFANILKPPVVTTLHGAFVKNEEVQLYKKQKEHNFISISDSQRVGAEELNYISTVYNGIEVDTYDYADTPNLQEPYLAFLGRLSEEKGVHLAIQLAKDTGWKLIIAGKIDKADFDYYKNIVQPLIDNEQIIYIGELGHEKKVKLLKGASATIHPVTWPEPFGLVMAESMACGTPVYALNMGSIPEVIKDGVTGFIADDIDSLTDKIKYLNTIDRKTCREHIQQNFSSEIMTQNYLNTYAKVIAQHNSSSNESLSLTHEI